MLTRLHDWDEYSAEWLIAGALRREQRSALPGRDDPPPALWASPWIDAWARRVGMGHEAFIMGKIAIDSQSLEGQPWDRWQPHAAAVSNAYHTGQEGRPLELFKFFLWHSQILPHGGSLRTLDAVSVGMGESFDPADWRILPRLAREFVTRVNHVISHSTESPFMVMAQLHFDGWKTHFWSDGNKRHCRVLSNYIAGWYHRGAIDVTLNHKKRYLDALQTANIAGLAALLEECEVASLRALESEQRDYTNG